MHTACAACWHCMLLIAGPPVAAPLPPLPTLEQALSCCLEARWRQLGAVGAAATPCQSKGEPMQHLDRQNLQQADGVGRAGILAARSWLQRVHGGGTVAPPAQAACSACHCPRACCQPASHLPASQLTIHGEGAYCSPLYSPRRSRKAANTRWMQQRMPSWRIWGRK